MKLTPEILLANGFIELEEKDITDCSIYRLSDIQGPWGSYGFDLEVVLGNYPESNPNSGILSIHLPSYTTALIPEDLWNKKEDWTEEDQERYENNLQTFEASRQPVAWHVTTLERLKDLVKSLTLKEL
jgi:hypothetical protein